MISSFARRRPRRLYLLALAATALSLASSPAAEAAPKPKLKVKALCQASDGSPLYGLKVWGKHLPPNTPVDATFDVVLGDGSNVGWYGEISLTDEKGRFFASGATSDPILSIRAFVTDISKDPQVTYASEQIEHPCQ